MISYMHNLLSGISLIKKRSQSLAKDYLKHHQNIYEAIINKEIKAAEEAIKKHIDNFISDAKKNEHK